MDNTDKDFAKLLKMMQRQGERNNPTVVEIGIMTSPSSCIIGELPLNSYNLLLNSNLKDKLDKGDKVAITKVTGQDLYVILCKVVDA